MPTGKRAGSETGWPLPGCPGAYLLAITLAKPVALALGRHGFELPPGAYVYVGNARGPGGIRARVTRYLEASGRVHWHIDRLLPHAPARLAVAVPSGDQCVLSNTLLRSGDFVVAARGFGSSDCRCCPSHLLRWQPSGCPRALLAVLARLLGGRLRAVGRLGGRRLVIEQDALGGTIEVVELTAVQRPEESEQAEKAEGNGDRDQIDEDVHGNLSRAGPRRS